MPQFGNKSISLKTITDLAQYFNLKGDEDEGPLEDTMYLTPKRENYTAVEVMDIAELIGSLCPDECALENGALRLWWD